MQETLSVVGGGEAAHLTLLLSRGLVRDFGAVVRIGVRIMGDPGHEVPLGDTVATQPVSHETTRCSESTCRRFRRRA